MRIISVFPIILAASLAWSAASAADGDAVEGKRLAGQWCSSCHATSAGATASDTAPAFTAIAADPAQTDARLRLWIARPHGRMPNPNLSRLEIENVVAYLRTLRRK